MNSLLVATLTRTYRMRISSLLVLLILPLLYSHPASLSAAPADDFPPGWLPVNQLDAKPTWSDVRQTQDRIQLYLPHGEHVFHFCNRRAGHGKSNV